MYKKLTNILTKPVGVLSLSDGYFSIKRRHKISQSLDVGRQVCTKIKVARELCISTRVLRVSTPDSIASAVSFENRIGRVKCSAQSSVGSKHLNGWLYCKERHKIKVV